MWNHLHYVCSPAQSILIIHTISKHYLCKNRHFILLRFVVLFCVCLFWRTKLLDIFFKACISVKVHNCNRCDVFNPTVQNVMSGMRSLCGPTILWLEWKTSPMLCNAFLDKWLRIETFARSYFQSKFFVRTLFNICVVFKPCIESSCPIWENNIGAGGFQDTSQLCTPDKWCVPSSREIRFHELK